MPGPENPINDIPAAASRVQEFRREMGELRSAEAPDSAEVPRPEEQAREQTQEQEQIYTTTAAAKSGQEVHRRAKKDAMDKDSLRREEVLKREGERRFAEVQDYIRQIQSKGISKDQKGRTFTLYDKLTEQIGLVLKPEQRAFDDWRAAMMSLLGLFAAFVDALNQSEKELFAEKFFPLLHKIREKAMAIYGEKFSSFSEEDIPTLVGHLKFDEQKNLVVGKLDHASDLDFNSLVYGWLQGVGYTLKDGVYQNEDGIPLTNEVFKEIAVENDFSHYLEEMTGLSVNLEVILHSLNAEEEEPQTTPTPSLRAF